MRIVLHHVSSASSIIIWNQRCNAGSLGAGATNNPLMIYDGANRTIGTIPCNAVPYNIKPETSMI